MNGNQALDESTALEHCQTSIRQNSRSFYWASRLFSESHCNDAVALYAWCRRADDAVDEAEPPQRAGALVRLQQELDTIYEGVPQTEPALAAFADVVSRRRIPVEYPRELLLGMRMDVDGATYQTLNDLLLYCHRVAGVVGLMMCHIMGIKDDKALSNAAQLGIAMQLTNICRDVGDDWQLGRVYLPAKLWKQHLDRRLHKGPIAAGQTVPATLTGGISRCVKALLDDAARFYGLGGKGIPSLSFRCRWAVGAALRIYADIGRQLSRQSFNPLQGRAVVSTRRKLWLVIRAGFSAIRFRRGEPKTPNTIVRFPDDVLSF